MLEQIIAFFTSHSVANRGLESLIFLYRNRIDILDRMNLWGVVVQRPIPHILDPSYSIL